MIKIEANTVPCFFENQLTAIQHQCSTRFSKNSFVENHLVYCQTKLSVSSRGPRFCNKLLDR